MPSKEMKITEINKKAGILATEWCLTLAQRWLHGSIEFNIFHVAAKIRWTCKFFREVVYNQMLSEGRFRLLKRRNSFFWAAKHSCTQFDYLDSTPVGHNVFFDFVGWTGV